MSDSAVKTAPDPDARRKTVVFGNVAVRQYHMILGSHPGTKAGLPLTIDWEPVSNETTPVDMFEYLRRRSKRGKKPTRLTVEYRRDYLYSLGLYSNEELVSVLLECLEIRESRMHNAGEEFKAFFLNDSFFETSAAALAAGGNTLKSVLKSTKAIGDTSVSAALKGSQAAMGAAVTAALTASKATSNAVGASSKVIVKVSAEGAKTIVKVVSSSAEKVRRSPSVGRSRSASEEALHTEELGTGAVPEVRRRRPSLGRKNSGEGCASSTEEDDESGVIRLVRRRRSLGRVRSSESLSSEDASSEEFGGTGAPRSRSRVRRVHRVRQAVVEGASSSMIGGADDAGPKTRRRRSLGRRLKPVENHPRETEREGIFKRSLSLGKRRIHRENNPAETVDSVAAQHLSTHSSSTSFRECDSAEFEVETARDLKPDPVAILTAS